MKFDQAYNRETFLHFLEVSFLPDDFLKEDTHIEPQTKMIHTQIVTKLGVCKSLDLVVYEVKHKGKDDPRVGLSKEAFRLLADEWQDKALIAFVPEDDNANYRFSLITIDTIQGAGAKIKNTYSNPRRYSYYLGEGISYHTPNKYLNSGVVKNDKDLKDRFSVEVLTKAFYNELSDWYAWAVKIVRFPNKLDDDTDDDKFNTESVIRMITRLIFVWFLKQKKLVPDELFDEKYIADNFIEGFNPNKLEDLFVKSNESKYYKAVLQNLFFAMLNSPITSENKEVYERQFKSGRSGYDNNKLMRYKDMFKNPNLFVELANKHVPFLNGGLFDCLDDKDNGNYIDGFSDRDAVKKALVIPDYLFFGEEVGKGIDLSEFYGDKKKKKVSARGIIDILKRYNFTIEENTPFDQDVSLDPELLGKVFENLLASFNPETKTTARKQTGSFYTPREIVQYMVDESLIAHLKRTVGDELEEEYRILMKYTDEEDNLSEQQKKAIMHSLHECKILDPACGSGAFPMGVLQQMVHILTKLDPNNTEWEKILMNDAINETSNAYRNVSSEDREEIIKDINRSFDKDVNHPDYARKLYLIERCIFGVDIQSIAVQISKLRFFISLVVDQKKSDDAKENFGIRPLPNLEAKFVAANTLIGLNKTGATIFDNPAIKQKEEELKIAKHKIFGAKTSKTKRKYRLIVSELRIEIANLLSEHGSIGSDTARQLQEWDMFDQNASSPFFDPEWMFGVTGGFDIVIGNPPYGAKFNTEEKKYFKDNYKHQDYQPESYLFFIEKGLELTIESGVLSYIIPNTWLTNLKTEKIRRYIFENLAVKNIVHFIDSVFDAIVDTEVIIIQKMQSDDNIINVQIREDNIKDTLIPQSKFTMFKGKPISIFESEDIAQIKCKLEKIIGLGQLCKITQGAKPFQVGKGKPKQTREIVNDKPYVSKQKNDDSFVPLLRGSLMNKYRILWNHDYWISFGNWLAEPRYTADYDAKEKIIVRQTGDGIVATIDNNQFIVRDNLYTIISINECVNLTYILGILNSSLINWYYQNIINSEKGEALAQVKKGHLLLLPIQIAQNQQPFIDLVDEIMELKKADSAADISALEAQIDQMVYALYNLTYDEVLIIDPNTPITIEEYENV